MITVLYAVGASVPLVLGAALGVRWRPGRWLTAAALAFATGALLVSVAFELFEPAYAAGGAVRSGVLFASGAAVFVVADEVLDRFAAGSATGWALLAGVTLDGVPENTALGVTLASGGSIALLVAVFASNFPEALTGAAKMKEDGRSSRQVVALWTGAAVLLCAAVLVGRYAFAGASDEALSYPLAFAAGAVLASVIDTLAPEAYRDGGPLVALAGAAGFLLGFLLGV